MKKHLAWIMVLCVMIVMVGCGKDEAATPSAETKPAEKAEAVVEKRAPLVTVISNGEAIAAHEVFRYSESFNEDGSGESADGICFEDMLSELRDQLPAVTWQEGIALQIDPQAELRRISVYDSSRQYIARYKDISELSELGSGEYYVSILVHKEYENGCTGYDCGFLLSIPDHDPIVTIISDGKEVVPPKYWFCGREWVEDGEDSGWMYSDGMGLSYRLEEVGTEFPSVQLSTDFSVNYAENTTPREIRVYNEEFQLIGESKNWEKLKTLESGSYYAVLKAFRNGTELHEGETDYDGYESGIRLIVPEGYEPFEVSDKNTEPLVTAVTAKGDVPFYEYGGSGLFWLEETQQGVYRDTRTLQETIKHGKKIVFPEISLGDLTGLKFSEDAILNGITVFDAEFDQEVAWYSDESMFLESDYPELEKGEEYILRVLVLKYGFRIIDGEREHNFYECVCRLTVPE